MEVNLGEPYSNPSRFFLARARKTVPAVVLLKTTVLCFPGTMIVELGEISANESDEVCPRTFMRTTAESIEIGTSSPEVFRIFVAEVVP